MAHPGNRFVAALRRHAAESAENRAQLVRWKSAALTAIGEGRGGAIVSGSGNGIAFSQVNGMTNQEWFSVLDEAMESLTSGLSTPTRTIARVC